MWDERRAERVEKLRRMTRRDVRGRDERRRTRTRLWRKRRHCPTDRATAAPAVNLDMCPYFYCVPGIPRLAAQSQ